jgi:hypothetical protein
MYPLNVAIFSIVTTEAVTMYSFVLFIQNAKSLFKKI